MTFVAFQLYSARNAANFNALLSMLAEAGYSTVEGYPEQYLEPEKTQAALKSAGLDMPSGHFPLEMLEGDMSRVLSVAKTLGITRIYCPYLDEAERPKTAEGWKALATRLEVIARKITACGLVFGWHNHDFEFEKLSDGSFPMALLLDNAPSVTWEADVAWIVRGRQDPFLWIARYKERLSAVHVKDIAPEGECLEEDGWADVGHGAMDWQGLIDVLKTSPASHFVIEHDNPSDIERFAKRSIANLNGYLG